MLVRANPFSWRSMKLMIRISSLKETSPEQFAAITMQGISDSPVGYLNASGNAPMRSSRADIEDTRSLIISDAGFCSGGTRYQNYVLAESIGRWDARWG